MDDNEPAQLLGPNTVVAWSQNPSSVTVIPRQPRKVRFGLVSRGDTKSAWFPFVPTPPLLTRIPDVTSTRVGSGSSPLLVLPSPPPHPPPRPSPGAQFYFRQ